MKYVLNLTCLLHISKDVNLEKYLTTFKNHKLENMSLFGHLKNTPAV